ncbi:MAG: DEAD/DEAH box helicase [bacterium]
MTFQKLGLKQPLLDAISEYGYRKASPIQEQSIPVILDKKDLMGAAQTGTGKTAAFVLPVLQNLESGPPAEQNQARCLILTPTRELAAQIAENILIYGKYTALKSTVVFGGVNINPQIRKLRPGVDLLVATPGRLLDLYRQGAVRFNHLEVLVLDEADRMLDMGFIHDIRKIISKLPKNRQNLMFSATFSRQIQLLAKGILSNPTEISVSPKNSAAETVIHWMYSIDKAQKSTLLIYLLQEKGWHQALIFTRTKYGADKLTKKLNKAKFKSAAIHGDKRQGARTKALADFKQGKINFLVATDIAARGLDIDQLPLVINHDLPNVPSDYVHRIGRTGRAGTNGQAVSLVSKDEIDYLSNIERLLKQKIKRQSIEGFIPSPILPQDKGYGKVRVKQSKKSGG